MEEGQGTTGTCNGETGPRLDIQINFSEGYVGILARLRG